MSALDRRSFLALGGAAAAVSALPIAPPAVETAAPAVGAEPMWIVGTPGESDWQAVRAATPDLARRYWAEDLRGEHDGSGPEDECDCEFCLAYRGAEAERAPQWEGRDPDALSHTDWLRAGYGCLCSRCSDECGPDDAHEVKDEAVCEYCMTLSDWDIVDPERAAEMRAEAEEDNPAPPPSPSIKTGEA